MKIADLENWFSYHSPTEAQTHQYALIRIHAKELAEVFNEAVPDCADKTAAMRALRETVMQMNQAVACYQPPASVNI